MISCSFILHFQNNYYAVTNYGLHRFCVRELYFPVDDRYIHRNRNYYQDVQQPMFVIVIFIKVARRNVYTTTAQFLSDFQLIMDNCVQFYREGRFTNEASAMYAFVERQINQIRQDIQVQQEEQRRQWMIAWLLPFTLLNTAHYTHLVKHVLRLLPCPSN